MQIIRPIDVVAAGVPLVQIDATEVDYPKQRRQIANDGKIDRVARRMFDLAYVDPFRSWGRGPLLEKEFSRGAVWVAFHDHRAVLQVRQQYRGNITIVLQEIALRDFELGPEQLPQIRKLHRLTGNHRLKIIHIAWNQEVPGAKPALLAWPVRLRPCLRRMVRTGGSSHGFPPALKAE